MCLICSGRHRKDKVQPLALIRTGASRLERSFLWMHKKLISTIFTILSLAFISDGTAEMKATSFLLSATLMPMCQSLRYPGGCSAHLRNSRE